MAKKSKVQEENLVIEKSKSYSLKVLIEVGDLDLSLEQWS